MTVPLLVAVERLGRSRRERLEGIVRAAVPRVAPSLALSIWRDGRPEYVATSGWMDPERRTRPVIADARFDLASVTKLFTATAFLGLVSAGDVGLDDAVVRVIPELGAGGLRPIDGGQEPLTRRMLAAPPERGGWRVDPTHVTFRQLLAHTGGLAPWRAVFEVAGPVPPPPGLDDPVTPAERLAAALPAICAYPFVDRPGRASHYSDLGFMLLGEALARLTRLRLDEAIAGGVTAPLGLDSAGFTPLRSALPREDVVPTSADTLWRQRRCWGEVEDENAAGLGGIAGHAGLFATVDDVARLGQAWLERDARLGLTERVHAEAVRDQVPDGGDRRGLGWRLKGNPHEGAEHLAPLGEGAFGHTGFTGTSLAVDPGSGLVVALLTNRVHAGRTHEGIEALRHELHAAIAGR